MNSRVLATTGTSAIAVVVALSLPVGATPRGAFAPTARPSAAATTPAKRMEPAEFDVLRPSGRPVKLTFAPRDLSVRYTFGGKTYTLDDFLTRSAADGFLVLDAEDGQRIVDERYPSGNRGTRFQSWSMAKSFTSAAVGIALQEGHIRSIDDAVTAYLPELKGSGYDDVSIGDLLRMSSGIRWDERADVPKAQLAAHRGRSLRTIAGRLRSEREPGTAFDYNSMNSFVLAWLVTEATGTPYPKYVERKLWRPAGMADTARVGSDSRDALGYCCYYATERDYARFGLLYLRGGKAGGRQVVPASWVKRSTTPSSTNPRYGLHWWLGDGDAGDFMAAGMGGQYIYVSPEHQVVIVKSSVTASTLDRNEVLTAFRAIAAEVARTRG